MQSKSKTRKAAKAAELKAEGEPRLLMTKDGKRPLTPQGAGRRVVAALKAAREQLIKISQNARAVEALIAAPKGKTVAYALRAVLIELSNASEVNVDSKGVAGAFYSTAAFELRGSDNVHAQQTLRHLDVLLNNPTLKTATALIKYWDDPQSTTLKTDPFPAKRKGVKL